MNDCPHTNLWPSSQCLKCHEPALSVLIDFRDRLKTAEDRAARAEVDVLALRTVAQIVIAASEIPLITDLSGSVDWWYARQIAARGSLREVLAAPDPSADLRAAIRRVIETTDAMIADEAKHEDGRAYDEFVEVWHNATDALRPYAGREPKPDATPE